MQNTAPNTVNPEAQVPSPDPASTEPAAVPAPPEQAGLDLDLSAIELSPYYPVELQIYQPGEIQPLYSTQFFPAEQADAHLHLEPESLQTGGEFSLQMTGQHVDQHCLFDWTLSLSPEAATEEQDGRIYRTLTSSAFQLGASDFTRGDTPLDCRFIYTQAGQVRNSSGQALAGVSVRAEVRQRDGQLSYLNRQVSDAQGRFSFSDLPAGVFTWLVAEKTGYRKKEQTFSAQFDDSATNDGQTRNPVQQQELLNVILQAQ